MKYNTSTGSAVVEQLTNRERQIVSLIASGKTTKQIARMLDISFKTAVSHRYSAQAKLGAKNAAAMIFQAFQLGLIETPAEKPKEPLPMTRFSGMFAEQSRVREDLQASLKEAMHLRRRSTQLLAELQMERQQTRLLVDALRQSARVSNHPFSLRAKSLSGPENGAAMNGVRRRASG